MQQPPGPMPEPRLSLSLIEQHPIRDKTVGLNEPSGLTLNHDGTALYTVSDDTKAVFRLDLKGRLSVAESFFIGVDDLEGIAINADGSRLHAVQEESNAVISIDIASRRELSRRPLAAMANYASIARYFPDPPDNKGLEGITVNTRTGHVFVVKEGRPGLLIELDSEGNSILTARLLNDSNGFVHPTVGAEKLDFSGLSYDAERDTIWITSDKGQCLFHYDWDQDQVLQRLDLVIDDAKKPKRIRKSEGVAMDPVRQRLYVVSERDGILYVFRINADG